MTSLEVSLLIESTRRSLGVSSIALGHGAFMLRAPQREKNRRAKSQERQTEPKALALAREIAQMVERHLLSGGDFAPAGEVLPQALLHVIRHLHSSPARVVLLRS